MNITHNICVARDYTTKDENGVDVKKTSWPKLGRGVPSGKGTKVIFDFQPRIINGELEPIFLFPIEKKEVSNG